MAQAQRSSTMQWSFSNKVSTIPQLVSFKSPQESWPRKTLNDPLGPSNFMTISGPDAFDSTRKTFPSVIQRNFVQEKQVGRHYPMTVHNHHQEVIFPNQPNQTVPAPLSIASGIANTVPSTTRIPTMSSSPVVPINISVVGTTDLRNATKPSPAPTQLTIFYGGSVNVYEDISPETAQAIMLLATNGSSHPHNKQVPVGHVEAPAPKTFIRNWSFSSVPSPIPMTIRPVTTQCGGTSNANGLSIDKKIGDSPSSSNHRLSEQATIVVSSIGPPTVAIPQARKASLARFLEKRKERVISTMPYNVPKQSEGVSLSINSSSSSALSAMY